MTKLWVWTNGPTDTNTGRASYELRSWPPGEEGAYTIEEQADDLPEGEVLDRVVTPEGEPTGQRYDARGPRVLA